MRVLNSLLFNALNNKLHSFQGHKMIHGFQLFSTVVIWMNIRAKEIDNFLTLGQKILNTNCFCYDPEKRGGRHKLLAKLLPLLQEPVQSMR